MIKGESSSACMSRLSVKCVRCRSSSSRAIYGRRELDDDIEGYESCWYHVLDAESYSHSVQRLAIMFMVFLLIKNVLSGLGHLQSGPPSLSLKARLRLSLNTKCCEALYSSGSESRAWGSCCVVCQAFFVHRVEFSLEVHCAHQGSPISEGIPATKTM